MAYKLKYEHPMFPKDHEVEIPDLGVVKNGGTLTVTPDAEQTFCNRTGKSIKEAFAGDEHVTIEGTSEMKAGDKK